MVRVVVVAVLVVWLHAPLAAAEMYQYVDSQGRLHFAQDIGQVPPEYRSQVKKKVLQRDISVTGEEKPEERLKAMKKRSNRLERRAAKRRPTPAAPAAAPRNPLEGAPEPRKYDRECWYRGNKRICRKSLTPEWRKWNAANGGDNGKSPTRWKLGGSR